MHPQQAPQILPVTKQHKQALVLTYMTYFSAAYMLNVGGFCRSFIIEAYKITIVESGYAESIRAVGEVLGTTLFFFNEDIGRYPIKYCSLFFFGYIISSAIILALSFMEIVWNPLICLCLVKFVSGLFQINLWSMTLLIMIKSYKIQEKKSRKESLVESSLFSMIWPTSYQTGPICSLVLSNFFTYSLEIFWQFCVIFAIGISSVSLILQWVYLREYIQCSDIEMESQENLSIDERQIPICQVWSVISYKKQNLSRLASYTCYLVMSEMSVGFPLYYNHIGFSGSEGIISAVFYGSVLSGVLLYVLVDFIRLKKQSHEISQSFQQNAQKSHKNTVFWVIFILSILLFIATVVMLFYCLIATQKQFIPMVIMIGIFGLLYGPIFNYHIMIGNIVFIDSIEKIHHQNYVQKLVQAEGQSSVINKFSLQEKKQFWLDLQLIGPGLFNLVPFILLLVISIIASYLIQNYPNYYFGLFVFFTFLPILMNWHIWITEQKDQFVVHDHIESQK